MNRFKKLLRYWVMALIYPRPFIGISYLPRYIYHWIRFSRKHHVKLIDSYPCLGDWTANTPFDPHYFYQAAWLARHLAGCRPLNHVDIGSDVKTIGIISAFVPTQFVDYRPLRAVLSGLVCIGGDILALPFSDGSIKSLSCLHVVEHIGLGRYGDPIDPTGSLKALAGLERVVAQGGRLYLSVPVGRERVCFNAHRVFSPESIIQTLSNMRLVEFSLVDDEGRFYPNCSIMNALNLDYGCGMFVMEKKGIN